MSTSKPVIVLIPGAFHRPSVWNGVVERLRSQGFTALTPPLAVCGDLTASSADAKEWKDLADKGPVDDAKLIHDQLLPLLDEGKEAIVVSHSYGSVPACVAIEGQTTLDRAAKGLKGGIRAVINIAGFASPVRGKSLMGTDDEPPLMPYHVLEEGVLHLQDDAKPLWYSDLSPEARDAAWNDLHMTQSRKAFLLFPQFIESDIKVPKTYVFTENDEAVSPAYQEMFITTGAYDNVVRVPSGHTPALSMPDKVVEIIVNAAQT